MATTKTAMKKKLKDIVDVLTRPLTAEEIEWRIQSSGFGRKGPWAKIVPYKTARTDRARLNEAVGPFGWKSSTKWGEFTEYVKDKKNPKGPKVPAQRVGFITVIEIQNHETGEWIGKYGCAAATDIESFKGGDSDSFKRAGFAWGIGEELYDMDVEWADTSPTKKAGYEYATAKNKSTNQWDEFYWKPKSEGRVYSEDHGFGPGGPETTESQPVAEPAAAPAPASEPTPRVLLPGDEGYKARMAVLMDVDVSDAQPHVRNIYRKYTPQATAEGWHDDLVEKCREAKDRINAAAGIPPHPGG